MPENNDKNTDKLKDQEKETSNEKKEELDDILRMNFHPRFRDTIMGVEKNWDERIFRKSCNKSVLKTSREFIIDDLMELAEYFKKKINEIQANISLIQKEISFLL